MIKKGLIAALSLVVFAAASTTFANAPFFTGDIPDVCIGDNEDRSGAGLTVDTNFFRYLNAINILDYVDDTDSASPDLKFAFFEGTDADDVSINGATQVDNPEDAGTWLTNTITNPWFSFRDLVRSPAAGTSPFPTPTEPDGTTPIADGTQKLLPWHNNQANLSELSDDDRLRDVWIVVCDEDGNLISKSMLVYSMNSGDDLLSSGVDWNVVLEDNSPSSAGGWDGTSTVPHLTKATTSEGAGYLQMSSGTTDASGDGYWGRWRQTATASVAPIEYVETDNVIYCARIDLELNAATSNERVNAPNIRLGVTNQLDILTTMNVIKSTSAGDSTVNPHLPNVGETRTYDVVWARNEQLPDYSTMDLTGTGGVDYRRFRLFFDVLDPDSAGANKGGTWRLKKVVVGTTTRPADMTIGTLPANTLAFLLDDVTAAPFTGEVAGSINGSIQQTGGNAIFHSTGTAGAGKSVLLYNASAFAPWMSGKLMRVIANLSCVDAADRTSFGQARVRHEAVLGNVNQEFIVKKQASLAACVPAASTATPYEIYLPSYGGPNQAIIDAGANFVLFKVAVDHLNFAAGAGSTDWVLQSMQYELLDELDLP